VDLEEPKEYKIDNNIIDDNIILEKVKPELLQNNIQLLYDQSTERSRKRNFQMRQQKLKIEKVEILEKIDLSSPQNINNDYNKIGQSLALNNPYYSVKQNKISLLENAINTKIPNENNKENNPAFADINEEPEVNVSFIDEDIQPDETEIKEKPITHQKTLIPLKNNLVDKNIFLKNESNFTDSYLQALGMGSYTSEQDDKKKIKTNSNDLQSSNKNYILNPIVEEDNSNFSDSDIESHKRKSFIGCGGSISSPFKEKSQADQGNLNLSFSNASASFSPKPSPKNKAIKSINDINEDNYNIFFSFKRPVSNHVEDLGKLIREKINKICHKISKSDIVDARIGIVNIMENLNKKYQKLKKDIIATVTHRNKLILKQFLNVRCKFN